MISQMRQEHIRILRDEGFGYTTIAKELGLSKDQVSFFAEKTVSPIRQEIPDALNPSTAGAEIAVRISRTAGTSTAAANVPIVSSTHILT